MPKDEDEIETTLAVIAEALDPLLEDGVTYYCTLIHHAHHVSGGRFYVLEAGRQNYDADEALRAAMKELRPRARLSRVVRKFEQNRKICFVFEKGKAIQYILYDVPMVIDDIRRELLEQAERTQARRIVSDIEYIPREDVELYAETRLHKDDGVTESSAPPARDDVILLYHMLEPRPSRLRLTFENDRLHPAAEPAYPLWNIAELEGRTEPALDESLPGLSLNKLDLKLVSKLAKQSDAVDFSYMVDADSRLVVDVLGTVVDQAFDFPAADAALRKAGSEEELQAVYAEQAALALAGLHKLAAAHADHWIAGVCKLLTGTQPKKILFDHSRFEAANESPVLAQFLFALHLNHTEPIFIDVFQSAQVRWPDMFWMLPAVPMTNWGEVQEYFPPNPLSFRRKAQWRDGDSAPWRNVEA